MIIPQGVLRPDGYWGRPPGLNWSEPMLLLPHVTFDPYLFSAVGFLTKITLHTYFCHGSSPPFIFYDELIFFLLFSFYIFLPCVHLLNILYLHNRFHIPNALHRNHLDRYVEYLSCYNSNIFFFFYPRFYKYMSSSTKSSVIFIRFAWWQTDKT